MDVTLFIDFIYSIALLLSLGLLYDNKLMYKRRVKLLFQKIITGIFIGLIAMVLMSRPWEFSPGYFFDSRTVLMAISGLFFGYTSTFIAMFIGVFFRINQGGGGVIPGSLWIIIPALSGLLWKKIRSSKDKNITFGELLVFGIIVHVLALLSLFILPMPTPLVLISNVGIPIMLLFPIGTALLGNVLIETLKRKKTENQVTRLATVIEQLTEKITITDLNGNLVYLNHYFEEATGYQILEMMGQNLRILKSGYHDHKFYTEMWNTISGGKTWRGQIINKRKDGSLYYDESTIFPIQNEKGEIINYASFQRDTTEQRKMIEALKNSEENLETILNSIGDGVIATDVNGIIIRMNPIAEKITRCNSYKSEKKSLISILHMIDSQSAKIEADPVEMVLSQGWISEPLDYIILSSEFDSEYHISLSGSPLHDIDGIPAGVVLVLRDITEELKLRELMIHNEKMASVGGLAAGMAHEINNPLAGMMQSAAVIANRIGKKLDSPDNIKAAEKAGITMDAIKSFMESRQIFRMIESIGESGQRVAAIIENMISFSQTKEIGKSLSSITELFDKTINIAKTDSDLKNQYSFKEILMEKDYDSDLPFVSCEASKIQQVFLTLLLNGAEAMQDAGTINPHFYIRIFMNDSKDLISIEIEDNGPGMDEKTRKRIFEPFFTTKPVGKGTGLGLSVTYFIITEDHQGEMSVQSRPGQGSKFLIKLPLS
jgi:PAS domain S-box-containing protein